MGVKAIEVARYIIACRRCSGDAITQLKLQKLLYYSQAWHLGLLGTGLFAEDMEAWVHGPVVPSVRANYWHHRWSPLPQPNTVPDLPKSARDIIDRVLELYGSLSAYELEQISHEEEPWQKARANTKAASPSRAIISKDSMQKYYRKQATEA